MSDGINKGGAGSGRKGHVPLFSGQHVNIHSTKKPNEYKVHHKLSGDTWHMSHTNLGVGGDTPEKHQNSPGEKETVKFIESRHGIVKGEPLMYKAERRPYTEDINDLIEKGGKGSGIDGHTTQKMSSMTASKKNYSWGTMRHVESHKHDFSIPIHPEHFQEMKDVHEGRKDKGSFKDETGTKWGVQKHPEGGIHLSHSSARGTHNVHLKDEHMKNLDDGPEDKPSSYKGDPGAEGVAAARKDAGKK